MVVAYFATGGDFKEAIGEAFTWWGWLITGSIFVGAAIYAFAETDFSLTGCLGTVILLGIFVVLVMSGAFKGCSSSSDTNCYPGPRGMICN